MVLDSVKPWLNPELWKKVQDEEKNKKQAEDSGMRHEEGGFFGFVRENALYEEQGRRVDAEGRYVPTAEEIELARKVGEGSRIMREADPRYKQFESVARSMVSRSRSQGMPAMPTDAGVEAPKAADLDLVRRAQKIALEKSGQGGSFGVLADVLKNLKVD